jgi:predicted nuclease with TOPRIM domain
MNFDNLVQISADFYTPVEIRKAQTLMSQFVTQRLPAHKGPEKEKARKSVKDLLKLVLDPSSKLPAFCAVNITRLPPVGIDHIDVAALMQELTMLRSEVRCVSAVRTEIAELKCTLQTLKATSSATTTALQNELAELQSSVAAASQTTTTLQKERAELKATSTAIAQVSATLQNESDELKSSVATAVQAVTKLHIEFNELKESTAAGSEVTARLLNELAELKSTTESDETKSRILMSSSAAADDELAVHDAQLHATQTLTSSTSTSPKPTSVMPTSPAKPSAAQIVAAAAQSGALDKSSQVKTKTKPKAVIGKFTGSDKIRSANSRKNIELFVTRLSPMVEENDLRDFVFDAMKHHDTGSGIDVNVVCEKLNTKFDSYHSYHVTVSLCAHASIFKEAVSMLMSSQAWPMGVLVRRFFLKKNG